MGTLNRAIGLLVAAVWFASIFVIGRFRKPHLFHLLVYLFILWNIVSFFWSVDIDETIGRIKTYTQLAILSWILWDLYTTPEALRAALQAYILGGYVTIGSTISNYLAGNEISIYSGNRFSGAGLNANDLALILALGLPVAWYLATSLDNSIRNQILKAVNYAYIPAALFAILLTGTRMAIFAVVPFILYILVSANQLKLSTRIFIFPVIIFTLFVLQTYIPRSIITRLATIDDSIMALDLGGRVSIWRASLTTFLEHPILGVGSGAIDASTELGGVVHNSFLSVLAELGLIGIIFFVTILAMVTYCALIQPKSLSRLWLTVLSIWTIGASTLTWEFRKPTWLFMSLIVISASIYATHVRDGELPMFNDRSFDTSNGPMVQRNAYTKGSNQ